MTDTPETAWRTAVRELSAWLAAVLDERERVARAAQAEHKTPWRAGTGHVYDSGPDRVFDAPTWDGEVDCMDHAALHDPAAVLADIAAKRAIIETCEHYIQFEVSRSARLAAFPRSGVCDDILRALASAYASEPGYREEWKPQ